MELNAHRCYQAIKARDARFDGQFFIAVKTTGIYCRPVCTAITPKEKNCRFFPVAAAAEREGFRPCLRCRPELAPGYATIDITRRVAHQTAARIEAGALDHGSLENLALEFGYSSRQLRRVVEREYGVTPVELAQTRRLLLAKQLLTDSSLPMLKVAQASGFASVRRFNHLFRSRYGLNPTGLRRKGKPDTSSECLTLKLGYRPPLAWTELLQFLAGRGAAGVECADGNRYWRTVRMGEHKGWISATPSKKQNVLHIEVAHSLLPVLTPLLARLRGVFDLDANPAVIGAHLAQDSRLKPWVRRTPGLRVPGALDGFELALRAILGQQITVKAATTIFTRFAAKFGEVIVTPNPELRFLSPQASRIADARLQTLIDLGLTQKRAQTVHLLAKQVASYQLSLEPSVDLEKTLTALKEIPGIGDWTAQYIAMRALRATDAFPASDLALLKALKVSKPREAEVLAEPWRPWRSYAALYLWNSLKTGG
ncbi:MAG: AlkA N-terminal domain-containing protein [Pseudomonadota bacterium]